MTWEPGLCVLQLLSSPRQGWVGDAVSSQSHVNMQSVLLSPAYFNTKTNDVHGAQEGF